MGKVRKFTSERIEICRNCLGVGMVETVLPFSTKRCPVCEGSGRVDKTTEITITVEPHKEG